MRRGSGSTACRRCSEVKGRSMWTIDGEVFGNAVGAAVILPDGSKTVRHRIHEARDRRRARRRVRGGAAPRGDGRAGHLRADRVPQRRRIRWPAVRRRRRPDAEVAVRDDLQRRDGRVPGGIRRSHVPDGDPPVVGPRRRGGRGGARACARPARHQHQRRSAEPGVSRPRRPSLGSALGGVRRPRHAGELPHRRRARRR